MRLQVCGQEFFTKTEDRPVITERVDYIKEHRPVEKEFVVSCGWKGGMREREVLKLVWTAVAGVFLFTVSFLLRQQC